MIGYASTIGEENMTANRKHCLVIHVDQVKDDLKKFYVDIISDMVSEIVEGHSVVPHIVFQKIC